MILPRQVRNWAVFLVIQGINFGLPAFLLAQTAVFEASWGTKPGQVGLISEPEKERCGPLSFCTDRDAVLLLDTVNQRLVRGTTGAAPVVVAESITGSTICPDGSGGAWVRNESTVDRISADGSQAARVVLNADSSKSLARMEGYGVELLPEPGGAVALRGFDQSRAIVSPPAQHDAKPDANQPPAEPLLHCSIKRMEGNTVRVLGLDADDKALVSVEVQVDDGTLGAVLFKGIDANGNLYVELERLAGGRSELEVHRYSPSGERLRVFALSNDYFTTVYKKTEVATDGSVYQMLTTPDGVRVIRFDGEAK